MKKLVVFSLLFVMALNMTACGNKEEAVKEPVEQAEEQNNEEDKEVKEEKPESDLKEWDVDLSDTTEVVFSVINEGADYKPMFDSVTPIAKVKIPNAFYVSSVDAGRDDYPMEGVDSWYHTDEEEDINIHIDKFLEKVETGEIAMSAITQIEGRTLEDVSFATTDTILYSLNVWNAPQSVDEIEAGIDKNEFDVKKEGNFIRMYQDMGPVCHYHAWFILPELATSVSDATDKSYPVLDFRAALPVEDGEKIDYCKAMDEMCKDMVEAYTAE